MQKQKQVKKQVPVARSILNRERQSRGKKPAPKSDETPPSPEEISAAVASIVLAELEMWPAEVVSLIGEDHPNRDSFVRGVSYVIGAYMAIARRKLDRQVYDKIRMKEVETAKALGPVTAKLSEIRKRHEQYKQRAADHLRQERDRALKEAVSRIKKEFAEKIDTVLKGPPPIDYDEVAAQDVEIRDAFQEFKDVVNFEAAPMYEIIDLIDAEKEDWNSSKRKKRRAEHLKNSKSSPAEGSAV